MSVSFRALSPGCAAFVAGLGLAACASAPGHVAASCSMSASDQAWIDRALSAWQWALPNIVGVEPTTLMETEALFFSAHCVLTSRTALTDPANPSWSVTRHGGTIELLDGDEVPVGATSFVNVDGDRAWLVMSTPSL